MAPSKTSTSKPKYVPGVDKRIGGKLGVAAAHHASLARLPLKTLKRAVEIADGQKDKLVRLEYVLAAQNGVTLKSIAKSGEARKLRARLARLRRSA